MGLVNGVYSWPSVKALYFSVFSMNLAGLIALAFAILWAVRFERGFGDYLNLITPGWSLRTKTFLKLIDDGPMDTYWLSLIPSIPRNSHRNFLKRGIKILSRLSNDLESDILENASSLVIYMSIYWINDIVNDSFTNTRIKDRDFKSY